MLISLDAAGYLIDLAFPAAKAEKAVTALTVGLAKAARNRGRCRAWAPIMTDGIQHQDEDLTIRQLGEQFAVSPRLT
ncbi:hypothetical protein [Acidisoma sp. L85]|uniref:hypothetical protein n=1 Tax=Acidisoma sp. L85 TaxID=1641850 RepID=UPI00131E287E|nr:hypothetical protein [Acidisoma sp. L85]